MKKNIIKVGDGNSIIIQAHLDLITRPHPLLENFPYGAVIKNSSIKTINAKVNIRIREILNRSYILFFLFTFVFYLGFTYGKIREIKEMQKPEETCSLR
jgi:hypothetical protein